MITVGLVMAAVAIAVAGSSVYCQETKSAGEEHPRRDTKLQVTADFELSCYREDMFQTIHFQDCVCD